FGLIGLHFSFQRLAWSRRGGQVDQCVQHFLNPKIVNSRTKEHWCLLPTQKGFVIEWWRGSGNQLNFIASFFEISAKTAGDGRVINPLNQFIIFRTSLFPGTKHAHAITADVEDAAKMSPHSNWP